jgi:nicotinate-nucleotide adenylyltransferase
MCELAAKPYDWLTVSTLETDAAERSYTFRTMEKLHELYPADTFFFIMGGDSFEYFDKWMHPERIAALCTILVIPRDRFAVDFLRQKNREIQALFPCQAHSLDCEMYPVSSTQLRAQLREERVDVDLLPDEVLTYIQTMNLYRR